MIQLVRKAMKGDTDAFLELMERNSLAMYKVARGIVKNDEDAADAIQDTILKCFEKLHTLQKPEYFKTWMIRILINECNRILAHYKRVNMPGIIPEASEQDMSFAEFEFKEMLEIVEEKYRIILILYYVEGFKMKEIAELLDMKENTVKTRLSRARDQIREAYSADSSGRRKTKAKTKMPDRKIRSAVTEIRMPDGKQQQVFSDITVIDEKGGVLDEENNGFNKLRRYTTG